MYNLGGNCVKVQPGKCILYQNDINISKNKKVYKKNNLIQLSVGGRYYAYKFIKKGYVNTKKYKAIPSMYYGVPYLLLVPK